MWLTMSALVETGLIMRIRGCVTPEYTKGKRQRMAN